MLLQFVIASSLIEHQPAYKNIELFGFYFDQLNIFTRSPSIFYKSVSSTWTFSYWLHNQFKNKKKIK